MSFATPRADCVPHLLNRARAIEGNSVGMPPMAQMYMCPAGGDRQTRSFDP